MLLAALFVAVLGSSANPALVHHPVSTTVSAAQQKFDEGLTLVYAFNRVEARKRFEAATKLDPKLAIAWWGIALGVGPNINEQMLPADLMVARDALAKAKALEPGASPEERRYIDALSLRYPAGDKSGTYAPYTAYRNAMKSLAADYPDDLDAATLYAESIMDVAGAPWVDGVQSADDATISSVLSGVLARDPHHIGANHYLIHAWDHTGSAHAALKAADYLSGLTYEPADSHLQHMPGHTYLDVGDYGSLESDGRLSVLDDDAYAKAQGVAPFSLPYYRHNLDFWAGAALLLDDTGEIEQSTAEYVAGGNVGAMLVYARERNFAAVDAFKKPKAPRRSEAVAWHYARFLSALAKSDVVAATRESTAIDALLAEHFPGPPTNVPLGALVHGRLAHAMGDDATAVALLQSSLDETKDDPPEAFAPWFFPAGEWLGYILFERGDLDGAEAAFRAELDRLPNDGRVMYGLMRTLTREGRLADARALAPKIAANWRGESIDLHSPDI